MIHAKRTVYRCETCRKNSTPKHVYTGRKVWAGHEVYGKRYGSDELRHDTEMAMIGGTGKGLKG